MSTRRKLLIFFLGLFVVLIVFAVVFVNMTQRSLEKLNDTPINMPDLMNIEDGEYTGRYRVFPVMAEVVVKVRDHQITEIVLVEHNHGRGYDGEAIIDTVVEQQSLDVDVISGATYSSKVILLAIEDALSGSSD